MDLSIRHLDTDFLVIGGGTAGCWAALSFCEHSNTRARLHRAILTVRRFAAHPAIDLLAEPFTSFQKNLGYFLAFISLCGIAVPVAGFSYWFLPISTLPIGSRVLLPP
jgi:hypothetical protein